MISQEILNLMNANSVFALGTANGQNVPFYTRSFYVQGNVGDTELKIHIPEIMAVRPLKDLKENPLMSVNIADVTNFFARQIKGKFKEMRLTTKDEMVLINQFHSKIGDLLNQFFGSNLADGWKRFIVEPSVCIIMEIQEVYEQTPKRGTGGKLS
ncbi:hypothetical protein P3G55_20660 [Leptospira sp. 96542]|nr:hypothetical protein [Leptospira sp. 96542]